MKINEIILEGGWASTKTQGTVITPKVVEQVVQRLHIFEELFNEFLLDKDLPPITIGDPAGSGTYYKRDLAQQPDKEYGDVDIHFHIQEIPGLNNNQTVTQYANAVKEFCEQTPGFETENGKNVIVQLSGNEFVQVDLVVSYLNNRDWTKALAPEWNVKGVLCVSLYSALAEALNLSMGSHGVQAKTLNGERVKFTTIKGVELHQITNDKNNWAMDVAAYLGCTKFSERLKSYPGMLDEVRVDDIVNSIRGIAESLELNGIMNARELRKTITQIYLNKKNKVIQSSKFDKAETPAAIKKAEDTKRMLATKSAHIAGLIGG